MSPTHSTRLDNGHVPQRAWDKLGCRYRMIQAVGREETGQWEGKLGCGYGRNRCGKKTRNKLKSKQGRSKAKRIKRNQTAGGKKPGSEERETSCNRN